MHIEGDTIAMYAAGHKETPRYMTDLRDGDIMLNELAGFIFEASVNEASRNHVAGRMGELGDRGLRDGVKVLDLERSLVTDERHLKAENLTRIRLRVEQKQWSRRKRERSHSS